MRRGIVLILVSGLLTLFLLLAAAFTQVTEFADAGGEAGRRQLAARLAAGCGMEYAAARLWQEPRTPTDHGQLPTPENARDDWTARGPEPLDTPPSRRLNPSYSHGETWSDVLVGGVKDGAYVPGDDLFPLNADADGDGKFTARSGRLRGGPEFSLRIMPCRALACINSGELGAPDGDHDLDGILNRDDPHYREDLDAGYNDADNDGIINMHDTFAGPWGNGVPDWRDADFFGNQEAVTLLNNLGAILGVADPKTVPYAPGYLQMGTIRTSSLGTRVIQNRPRGGYASVGELRDFLSREDFEKAAPYLTTRGEIVPMGITVPKWPVALGTDDFHFRSLEVRTGQELPTVNPAPGYSFYPFHAFGARIDLNRAPLELVRASLRHLTASGIYKGNPLLAGLYPVSVEVPFVRLMETEADAIAELLCQNRPIRTWKRLLELLASPAAAAAWVDDPFTKTDDPATLNHDESNDVTGPRARLKQDLILAQAAPDHFLDPLAWRACSLEVPREADIPPLDAITGASSCAIRRVMKRDMSGPSNAVPYDANGAAKANGQNFLDVPRWLGSYRTPEFSLEGAPIRDFSVDCEGVSGRGARGGAARAAGEFSVGGAGLRLTSQQDFEMESDYPWLLDGGSIRVQGPCQSKNGIQSGPKFPLSSYDATQITPYPGAKNWVLLNDRYPRGDGHLQLAMRQWTQDELTNGVAGVPAPSYTLPFNPDDPEPGTWHDAADWHDNIEDPIGSPSAHRGPAMTGAGAASCLHRGYHMGPGAPRFARHVIASGDPTLVWNATTPPFPLPRATYPADINGNPVPNGGKIAKGTITGWIRTHGEGNDAGLPFAEVSFRGTLFLEYHATSPGGPGYKRLFLLTLRMNDTGSITTEASTGPPTVTSLLPGWSYSTDLAISGWHHFALVFDGPAGGDPDTSAVTLYFDGIPDPNPVLVRIDSDAPPSPVPAMRMTFSDGLVFDDLFFYEDSLDDAEVAALARQWRHAPSGTYVSPRYVFDTARFPDGASLRGIDWDAFIPEQTGGTVQVTATGYDGAGNPVGSISGGAWNGVGDPFRIGMIPPCRSFDVTVTMTAAPTLMLDGEPVLRDTPRLDSFSVHYTGGKPRWIGLADR